MTCAQLIEQAGSHADVIAKIEKAEAVAVLDQILEETDAIMVARGDLGVEIGVAEVPLLQKRIIMRSLEEGKPVITATQMLESMIEHAEPTRAEASDVANAVLDGSSALMLSGETAVGDYPVAAVAYMDRIARAVEPSLGYRHELPEADEEPGVGRAMSNAACDLAETLHAAAIIVPTATGRTASAVARLRPRRPIVALTHNEYAIQQMALEWGVIPLLVKEASDVQDLWGLSIDAARDAGVVDQGDRVVTHRGDLRESPGLDERDQGRHRLRRRRGRKPARRREPATVHASPQETPQVGALRRARRRRAARAPLLPPAAHLRGHPAHARGADRGSPYALGPQAPARGLGAEIQRGATLVRGARRLGLVKPGEHLFIVQGIPEWRRANARK